MSSHVVTDKNGNVRAYVSGPEAGEERIKQLVKDKSSFAPFKCLTKAKHLKEVEARHDAEREMLLSKEQQTVDPAILNAALKKLAALKD